MTASTRQKNDMNLIIVNEILQPKIFQTNEKDFLNLSEIYQFFCLFRNDIVSAHSQNLCLWKIKESKFERVLFYFFESKKLESNQISFNSKK
jgi:hypothetical protein